MHWRLRRKTRNGPFFKSNKLQKRYAIGDGLFGGARTVEAVKDASFSIAENEFVALVGESGSGKSTIAKLLVGLEQASGGRILLNGDDLTDLRCATAPSARVCRWYFRIRNPRSIHGGASPAS